MTADYDAETAVERELVQRLASVLWRLRRATSIETALFKAVTAEDGKIEQSTPGPILVPAITDLPEQPKLQLVTAGQSDAAATNELSVDAHKDIGDCLLRLTALPTFPLDRRSRYEHLLWRQVASLMSTLESLRRRKSQPRRSSFPFSFRRLEPNG